MEHKAVLSYRCAHCKQIVSRGVVHTPLSKALWRFWEPPSCSTSTNQEWKNIFDIEDLREEKAFLLRELTRVDAERAKLAEALFEQAVKETPYEVAVRHLLEEIDSCKTGEIPRSVILHAVLVKEEIQRKG